MIPKYQALNINYKKDNQILNDFSYVFEPYLYGLISDRPEENTNVLKILAGLVGPDNGSVTLDGKNVFTSFQEKERALRKQIGYVFQSGGLLSNLNVLENLLVPYDFHFPDVSHEEKMGKIMSYFTEFGISENILKERPAKLTISVRKALLFIRTYITEPKIIIYDDPCMNCGQHLKKTVLKQMMKLREENIIQIFCESVNVHMYEITDKIILLKEGRLFSSSTFKEMKSSSSDFVTNLISKLYAE